MKIGILSSLPRNTGASLRGKYIVNGLKRNGNDVTYFTPNKALKYKLEYLIFTPYDILRTINKKFDYLIVLKPFPSGCIPAILNNLLTKTKIIIDIDDLDSTYRKGFASKIIENIQKFFATKFKIATVQDNKNLIVHVKKKWGINNIITVEQGVDTNLFNPVNYNKVKLKKELGFKEEKLIVFTGHLAHTAVEELTNLIKIFKKLKGDRIKLVVVGGGPKLDYFKDLAKDDQRIIFTGYIENTEVPKYVSIADICLCYYTDRPANYYRNSMKVREYLSMGKTVVCTNVADLKKFSKYTTQTNPDEKSFLEGIKKALKLKENKNIMGRKREFILKNFSWENITKKLTKELSSLD